MNKDLRQLEKLFNIENFNIYSDDENYYFFRSLEEVDVESIKNKSIVDETYMNSVMEKHTKNRLQERNNACSIYDNRIAITNLLKSFFQIFLRLFWCFLDSHSHLQHFRKGSCPAIHHPFLVDTLNIVVPAIKTVRFSIRNVCSVVTKVNNSHC